MGAVTAPTATTLLVLGRGVRPAPGGWSLTADSAARVRAAAGYAARHEDAFARAAVQGVRPRVVFSGGWAEAGEGAPEPPAGSREGDLMLRAARAAGLDRHADLVAETRSRSTLENLVHTVEDGLLDGRTFSARHPLGIVTHPWHLPRARYLAGRVLGLRGAALLDVPAFGGDAPLTAERVARLAARLGFLGVRDGAGMLRRERWLVAALRRAERLCGVPARPATDEWGGTRDAAVRSG
jgi:uncharacterized SAM-binding protein YcdF (DUF218 family)